MADRPLHYAGDLQFRSGRTAVTQVGSGFAACCSGDRAYAIRRAGTHTHDRTQVTCKRCLAALAREVVPCGNCRELHPPATLAPVTVPWSPTPLRFCPACVERGVTSGILRPRTEAARA